MDIHLFGGNQKKQGLTKKLVLRICDLDVTGIKRAGKQLRREQGISPLESRGNVRPAPVFPADSHFSVTCLPIRSQLTQALEATANFSQAGSLLDKLPTNRVDHQPQWATGHHLQPALTSKDLIQVRQSPSSEVLFKFQEEELNCRKQE